MFSETTDKRPPSGEYVSSADEADKKLEAMGYTPVRRHHPISLPY